MGLGNGGGGGGKPCLAKAWIKKFKIANFNNSETRYKRNVKKIFFLYLLLSPVTAVD